MEAIFNWNDYNNDIHIGFYTELRDAKTCNRCIKSKPVDNFREKTQIRGNCISVYRHSICKDCDKESAAYYRKLRKAQSDAVERSVATEAK